MERKNKKTNRNAMFSLMVTALVIFGSCKKDGEMSPIISPGGNEIAASKKNASTTTSVNPILLAGLKSDGGFSYKLPYPLTTSGDNNSNQKTSTLRLFENGVELNLAHANHQDIRTLGNGRFSHWDTELYFSASDNSNPLTNGRTYVYTLDGGSPVNVPITPPNNSNPTTPTPPTSVPSTPSGLMGYAMVNGTTTGGAGGAIVTVSTLSALKSSLEDSSPKIIYVSGTIKGSGNEALYVKSNKSIIGKQGAVLEGISLYMFTVSNIIIQDITFKNYVTDAALMIKFATHHIWVDHCDFSTDRNKGWEYWGKDISITREADYITISWNKFHDNNLSVLISGGIEGHEADKGKLHVTMHHNYWYNVSEREPTMNYGSVHMFNNYHLNNASYSLGARAGGTIRTDNEYFENCKKPLSNNLAGDPPGFFSGVNTNIYSNCGANDIKNAISTWVPTYAYQSVLDPAANVPAIVKAGSGPRAFN